MQSTSRHFDIICNKMYYLLFLFICWFIFELTPDTVVLEDIMKKFDFSMKLHWNCKIYLAYMQLFIEIQSNDSDNDSSRQQK